MASDVQQTTQPLATDAWKDAVVDLLPRQGAWTEDEYLVLTARCKRLVEFTDGFLEILPPPTDKHQAILGFLLRGFHDFFEPRGGKVRFVLLRLRLRPGKIREPDLLVLLSATDPRRHSKLWEGADLVLEVVSEDKPERDLIDKRGDYAEARDPEYWIVNPMDETITVLRLAGSTYEEAGNYQRGQLATSVLLPEFSIDVAATFDAD
jgi:Uma2 family endonuclease